MIKENGFESNGNLFSNLLIRIMVFILSFCMIVVVFNINILNNDSDQIQALNSVLSELKLNYSQLNQRYSQLNKTCAELLPKCDNCIRWIENHQILTYIGICMDKYTLVDVMSVASALFNVIVACIAGVWLLLL